MASRTTSVRPLGASLGGNATRRLDSFDLDHMLLCLR
jgi:hypothetical protein